MLELATTTEWLLIAATIVVGAAIQGSIGFGMGVFAVPILALIDPAFVPVPVLLASIVLSVAGFLRERTDTDFRGAARVLIGRVPGSAIGVVLLTLVTTRTLSIVIGVMVLLAVVAFARGWHIPVTPTSEVATGVVSGALGTSTAVGGPPVALLYSRNRGPEVRATLSAILMVGMTVNIIALGIGGFLTTESLLRAVVLTVPTLIGFGLSSWTKRHVDGAILRRGILIASGFSATTLLVTVLFS
ncbi:MAG: sulfite exporter TauE/SafE family protein [Acidimicrobiia bacterium]|nr:MAG: sulfite exporter TauE/SafE family protein [Acidimicrobiia bacterium]